MLSLQQTSQLHKCGVPPDTASDLLIAVFFYCRRRAREVETWNFFHLRADFVWPIADSIEPTAEARKKCSIKVQFCSEDKSASMRDNTFHDFVRPHKIMESYPGDGL